MIRISRSGGATKSAGRRRVVMRKVDSELDSRCFASSMAILRKSRGTPIC